MKPPGYSTLKGATTEPADHLLFSQEDGVSISQEIVNEGLGTFEATSPAAPAPRSGWLQVLEWGPLQRLVVVSPPPTP